MSAASQPEYDVRVERHVMIPMRDGTRLAADLFMPDGEGPFPTLIEYLPYRKDDKSHRRQELQYHMARLGYVGCRLDVRGTGSSEGIAEDEYTRTEQLDGCDAIQWLAEQPWSNGRVAMWGISYGGFNAVQVAMHRPPALKAIIPIMFTDDRYKEECHYAGGSLRGLYTWGDYPLNMVAMNALPPHPDAVDGDWLAAWRDRLERQPAWVMRWLREQTDGEYWYNGSLNQNYDAIRCAVLAIGGWRDGYPSTPLRTYANLNAPKKVLIGPWTHMLPYDAFPGPRIDYLDDVLRFLDYWLRDVDNGVMDEPPVTVYVQEHDRPAAIPGDWAGYWRTEPGWPHPQGSQLALHLGPAGRLASEAPDTEGHDAFEYDPTVGTSSGIWCWATPVDQREDDARSLTYVSEPLSEPLEIIGEPVLEVGFSATAPVAGLNVHVVDVAPDGTAVLVAKGYLNATRHASFVEPEPLEKGRVYPLRINLDCTAWRFRPGHRIRLSLAGTEWPNILPTPYPSQHTVYWGGSHGGRLTLPVVPAASDGQVTSFAPPRALEPVADSHASPGSWQVTRDEVNETVSVRHGESTQLASRLRKTRFAGQGEVTACVGRGDPAGVEISAVTVMELADPSPPVKVVARANMTGSETNLHVAVSVEVELDGQRFFLRRWDESIPRQLM